MFKSKTLIYFCVFILSLNLNNLTLSSITNEIIIKIDNFQIVEQSDSKFKVRFTQNYSSSAIKSVGTKILEFTLIDSVFKISSEIFSK